MEPGQVPAALVTRAHRALYSISVVKDSKQPLPDIDWDKALRTALAATLPEFEQRIRQQVVMDLLAVGDRYYPTHAALNQTMDQAAHIAEIGLAAYDADERPHTNSPAAVEAALVEWRQHFDRRDPLVHAAQAVGISKHRIHVLTDLARTTINRILAGDR